MMPSIATLSITYQCHFSCSHAESRYADCYSIIYKPSLINCKLQNSKFCDTEPKPGRFKKASPLPSPICHPLPSSPTPTPPPPPSTCRLFNQLNCFSNSDCRCRPGQRCKTFYNGARRFKKCKQWKRINCKQSARWQHLSRLKASA
jgi:hypothetical protein